MFRSNFTHVDEYVGVEPTQSMAAEAATKLDRVHTATYEQASPQLPLNHFDLVVCNDVIEHMPDHDWFLDDVRKHIKPTGALLGSIPNVRFFQNMSDLVFRKSWTYQDWGVLDRTTSAFHRVELEADPSGPQLPARSDDRIARRAPGDGSAQEIGKGGFDPALRAGFPILQFAFLARI
jgi:SAM-dependent methyltransferase